MTDTSSKPLNAVLSDALTHLIQNWKTTVSGFLTISMTTTATLLPLGIVTPEHTVWLEVVQGLCKGYLSLIQKDGQGPNQ
jgi:hypothetical protein